MSRVLDWCLRSFTISPRLLNLTNIVIFGTVLLNSVTVCFLVYQYHYSRHFSMSWFNIKILRH